MDTKRLLKIIEARAERKIDVLFSKNGSFFVILAIRNEINVRSCFGKTNCRQRCAYYGTP